MASDLNEYLEKTIDDIGGLGRFQWLLILTVLGSKISVAWSTLMMTFGGAIPDWHCDWQTSNGSEYVHNSTELKTCKLENSTVPVTCSVIHYDPKMHTVVSEWGLVCDKDWTVSTITTIQMGGLLFGGFISGPIADTFGRKFTFFSALLLLLLSNGAAVISSTWEMFAALRFFIGLGCGFYLTVYFTFVIEFTPLKYRSMVIALPFWPVFVIIYACLCWLVHDWMYIQIAMAAINVPFFLGLLFVPESYRWLVSTGKLKEAHDVIAKIAKINRKAVPDINKFIEVVKADNTGEEQKKYNIVDLLKSPKYLRYTFALAVGWISCGYGYYAISFGVQQLSGNLYVNLILLNAMDIIGIFVWYLSNCMGRKWTTILCFGVGGLFGIGVGIIQFIDMADKDQLINGFALVSKLCVSTGWSAIMLLTSESYPTVIRNIGYGINNASARFGAMVAPQLVFASEKVPGLSYLLFGGLMLFSALLVITVPETNNIPLKDTIEIEVNEKQTLKDNNKKGKANKEYEKETYTQL